MMRCIYTHIATGRRQELHLSVALQPEADLHIDEQSLANKAAIGALAALLVQKGIITLDEATNACCIMGRIEILPAADRGN